MAALGAIPLEHALGSNRPHVHVSGITVRYDPDREPGDRVREVRLADDRRVRRDRTYTLAVPDFMAVGGSGYSMLIGQPMERTALIDLDATIQYLGRLRQPVELSTADRIVTR